MITGKGVALLLSDPVEAE